jgi:hypothetical protein
MICLCSGVIIARVLAGEFVKLASLELVDTTFVDNAFVAALSNASVLVSNGGGGLVDTRFRRETFGLKPGFGSMRAPGPAFVMANLLLESGATGARFVAGKRRAAGFVNAPGEFVGSILRI